MLYHRRRLLLKINAFSLGGAEVVLIQVVVSVLSDKFPSIARSMPSAAGRPPPAGIVPQVAGPLRRLGPSDCSGSYVLHSLIV